MPLLSEYLRLLTNEATSKPWASTYYLFSVLKSQEGWGFQEQEMEKCDSESHLKGFYF